jgi:hypothetical protein
VLPQEAVIAGSPSFVDALLPLVRERIGGAPRVADSPALAAALCQDGARLLVYEHASREWLSLCETLRGAPGGELVVVAAVPPEHAPDVADISAAASAVVAWNGDGRPLMDAVDRVLKAREAPRPAAARFAGPVLTPVPRPAVPRPTPVPPRPAARPTPVMTPSAPMAPAPAPRPAPTPPPPAAEEGFESLFDGEEAAEAEVVTAVEAVPAPFAAVSTTWPGTVLSAADGLSVVRSALSGLWPEPGLRPVTEQVIAALSTAEKAAALGHKLPFDAAPVRRAVGLRWQVAAAIATQPPAGTAVDQGAVQGILSGIDDVLAELKILSDDAAPEALRSLEAIRHDLVREAIDLTEALQAVAPPEVVEEITTSRKMRRRDVVPVTRMVVPPREIVEPERHVPWLLVVLLVLAVGGGAAYHGYRHVNRAKAVPQAVAGAPAGTVGAVTPRGKVVITPGGVTLDPREVENFKNLERAKGNEVKQLGPQTFIVVPAEPAPQAPAPQPQVQPPPAPQQGAKP